MLGAISHVILFWQYMTTTPLRDSGNQTYQFPNEHGFVLGIENRGHYKIKLLDVKVNGAVPTDPFYLGTPIHYGIRMVNRTHEPIKYVTIRYNYLGLTKSLTITRWVEYK